MKMQAIVLPLTARNNSFVANSQQMKSRKSALLFLIATFVFSCTNPSTEESSGSNQPAAEDGTAQMVKILKDIAEGEKLKNVPYFRNSRRAEQFRQQMEAATDPFQKANAQLYYGYELLNAGQNEQAIVVLEDLRKKLETMQFQDPKIWKEIKRILALSYIRLGEQENCIARYNADRCIMPFENQGIYEIQSANRTAIDIYKELLENDPEDYESRWMLNFAYMTLGEFPDKVPAKWRLPASAFKSDYPLPKFPNIADKIGVNNVALSGGSVADDFNNDGLIDIFASSWSLDDQVHYYQNKGDGTFADKTVAAGLMGITGGLNMQQTDYNNDGWMDVLILRGAWYDTAGEIPNSLLRNNGDGTFTDVTIEAGLLSYAPTQTAAWADFDNDGWVDLFIGNETLTPNGSYPCEFYKNNGDGTFTNMINEVGLGQFKAMIKGVTAGDVNDDGYLDLYFSFLTAKNYLLINQGPHSNGFITFGLYAHNESIGEPVSSFPCWFWDYDNDGWEDLFVAAFGEGNYGGGKIRAASVAAQNALGKKVGVNPRLYKNKGDGTFKDVTDEVGLWEGMFAMGSNFEDIDNDGFLDFYIGTGEPSYSAVVPNKMYRNDQGKRFQDVTYAGGFGHVQKGHAVSFADFDNDGDQDIFAVMGGAFEGDVFGDAFFLNPVGNENNWITLKLEGTKSNKAAMGAWVKVTALDADGNQHQFYRRVSSGSSFGGNSLQLEIGLGKCTTIRMVEVRWPNQERAVEVFGNIPVNSFVKLVEGSGQAQLETRPSFSFPVE
jgi:tetratricopeptide (TPR) repeat protein